MIDLPRAGEVRALLLDADGNLFPSEEPAFVASADVTNRLLASLGVSRAYTAEELRLTTTGKNFRTTAADLAAGHGRVLTPEVLADWVAEEKKVVSDYLGQVLRPDPAVLEPLHRLAGRYRLAVVSSSALSRLDECFRATGLAGLLPAGRRYSAEDSLPRPTSKPDPAIYLYAVRQLGVAPAQAVAVEDSWPGARSAVAAGIPTVGNLVFVPPAERVARRAALEDAGVALVIESWQELEAALPVSVE
ncbi:haloacid dehalogenase [Paractinoplanes abujensis]|uniref:Beta-phosphoglucomutase-like phosphatase (HAD superfamily) n=1 Tax=Paractinoplanes abujensis TaxID=882441 RepID=A0A7W7D3M6_9ACTN|nr:HAD family phosphatase [Actinoplanes abujensis]MBB4698388.1 beta-phosphoglucomutase-like phosphatase (HAD superfamily) [Actinoplanes abujensis]GID19126.1 haloacid dehalogenase [Actinoplanes abujensis]